LDDQETKEILVWMEFQDPKDHQEQEDDGVLQEHQVCLVCQADQDHLVAEDLRVTEVWLDQLVMMVLMDQMDLLVTQDEPEKLVLQDQKVFPDEVVATVLEENEEQLEPQEPQDHEVDKEKSEHLVKKEVPEVLEKLEPKEPRDTEVWMD